MRASVLHFFRWKTRFKASEACCFLSSYQARASSVQLDTWGCLTNPPHMTSLVSFQWKMDVFLRFDSFQNQFVVAGTRAEAKHGSVSQSLELRVCRPGMSGWHGTAANIRGWSEQQKIKSRRMMNEDFYLSCTLNPTSGCTDKTVWSRSVLWLGVLSEHLGIRVTPWPECLCCWRHKTTIFKTDGLTHLVVVFKLGILVSTFLWMWDECEVFLHLPELVLQSLLNYNCVLFIFF